MKKLLSFSFLLITTTSMFGQYGDEYKAGMVIKMNEEGTKTTRILLWGQVLFQDFEGNNKNDGFSVKRARILLHSQINDRFFIVSHFGVNGLNSNNLSPIGKSDDAQLFMHEMFLQFKVNDYLNIGAGLHNWGGISRLNGQGTINMLPLDNNRSSWSTIGLSDQYASNLGIFFNGNIKKFFYRFNISDALVKTLDFNTSLEINEEKYLGKYLLNTGKYSYSGYVDYQFLDTENLKLPYRVGTYLGARKVFNLGIGFFNQPNAIAQMDNNQNLTAAGVSHLNFDIFFDSPLGTNNAALTVYAQIQNSNMGNNYIYSDIVGNGNQFYGQVGYLLGKKTKENNLDKYKNRFQPYLAYSYRNFTALPEAAQDLKVGFNYFLDGHNAKLTLEYQHQTHLPVNNRNVLSIQAALLL